MLAVCGQSELLAQEFCFSFGHDMVITRPICSVVSMLQPARKLHRTLGKKIGFRVPIHGLRVSERHRVIDSTKKWQNINYRWNRQLHTDGEQQ